MNRAIRRVHPARLARRGLLVCVVSILTAFVSGSPAGAATSVTLGSWASTGPLSIARGFHTADHQAIRLGNGELLVEGGDSTNGTFATAVADAELFDPSTKDWTPTAPLGTARDFFTATLLPDGRVLVAGGYDSSNNALASAE